MIKKIKAVILLLALPFLPVAACHKESAEHPAITDSGQPGDTLTVADCIRCLVLTDQARPAIVIVDAGRKGKEIWSWNAGHSNVAEDKVKWFSHPDDAKPVYNKRYLLINASGGGVALVRIADGKAVFYAYAGKNPHSSELLPDGNIVTASSTDNRLVVFHADTTSGYFSGYRTIIPLPFAHNVVWDKKRQVLWSAGDNHLYQLQYNFNRQKPDLIKKDSFQLPGNDAHDLFPVYGKDSLWLTNTSGVYTIDMETKRVRPADFAFTKNIKSVSSGPPAGGWPILIMKPETKWWSHQVLSGKGETVFAGTGMRIYKARWFLENKFSY